MSGDMGRETEIVKKHLEAWKQAIFAEYIRTGRRASGSFGNSLIVEEHANGAAILGNRYFGALVYGRNKTTGGGTGSLLSKIYQWIDDKGISYKSEREHKSIAYAITKKIHETGIQVPNGYNDGKLIENSITDDDKKALQKDVGLFYALKYTADIKNTIAK